MNLGDIFKSLNQSINKADTVRQAPVTEDRNYRALNEIRNISPGQTIQGEVVGKDGNTVQIALDNENVLTARLERDLNIALGQVMSFEVKSNNSSLVSLTPLYANMANEATIMKALSAAGLSKSMENIKMVSDMMQEGLPIDRDSIAYMNRQLIDFPNANPESVIQMIRLGIPISEINIEQFELYKNNMHQILQGAEQIIEELPHTYAELMSEGRGADAASFYEQIIRVFAGGENAEAAKFADVLQQGIFGGIHAENIEQDGTVTYKPTELADNVRKVPAEDGIKETVLKENVLKGEAVDILKQEAAKDSLMMAGERDGILNEATKQVKTPVSEEAWKELGDIIRKMGAEEETVLQTERGSLSPKETLSLINNLITGHSNISDGSFDESVKMLFGSKSFHELLKAQIIKEWTIEPEQAANKAEVEQLYERIREQSARINEVFGLVGKADGFGARSIQNLQNNVDFINQMNQIFPYIQLPLMMSGNKAHGDLYVYTNKKNLARQDGNISALLHLDMENLGPMDVYVTMQRNQNKINTDFTLRDEESLDLIAEHIHILNERLEKRGYSMSANFKLKEEEKNAKEGIMQEILSQNKNISVLSRTSFDMRA